MALITIVDAVASSTESGTDAVNVFDGEYSSLGGEGRSERWASDYSDPQWIYVDLGDIYDLTEIRIWWEGAYSSDYDLEVSDDAANNLPTSDGGSAWTAHSTGHNAGGAGQENHSLAGSSGRYVRVYSHARGTSFGNSIWEIEVYGDAIGGALTGQTASIATAHGTPVASTTAPVTGQALGVAVAHGTAVPSAGAIVTGQAVGISVAHGTAAPALVAPATGQALSIALEHGSVSVPDSELAGRELTIALAAGSVAPAVGVPATGQVASVAVAHGSAVPQTGALVTGQTAAIAAAHGTVTPARSVSPLGRFLTIAMAHGNVSSLGPVVGQELSIAAAQGTVVPAVARAVTGQTVSIATSAGSVIAFVRAPVRLGRPRLRSVIELGKPRLRSVVEFGEPRVRNATGMLSPLQLPGAFMWFNADVVTTSGGDITAWPNLVSGVAATAGGTVGPAIEVVNGRNWMRFAGDGLTPAVGTWFTSTEAALLTPLRYLNSLADFYVVCTYQGLGNDEQSILFAASDASENAHVTRLAVNVVPTGYRATWFGANSTIIPAILYDTSAIDNDAHVIEVLGAPGYSYEMRVDGTVTEAEIATTISNQNAFDTFSIGMDVRNGTQNNPANVRIRDLIGATGTNATQRQQMRAFAAARAGIQL